MPLIFRTEINGVSGPDQNRPAITINTAELPPGQHALRLIADDGYNQTASQIVELFITANNPPEFSEIPPAIGPIPHLAPEQIPLSFKAIDPDQDKIHYTLVPQQIPHRT